jgi:hypothetical protein
MPAFFARLGVDFFDAQQVWTEHTQLSTNMRRTTLGVELDSSGPFRDLRDVAVTLDNGTVQFIALSYLSTHLESLSLNTLTEALGPPSSVLVDVLGSDGPGKPTTLFADFPAGNLAVQLNTMTEGTLCPQPTDEWTIVYLYATRPPKPPYGLDTPSLVSELSSDLFIQRLFLEGRCVEVHPRE